MVRVSEIAQVGPGGAPTGLGVTTSGGATTSADEGGSPHPQTFHARPGGYLDSPSQRFRPYFRVRLGAIRA